MNEEIINKTKNFIKKKIITSERNINNLKPFLNEEDYDDYNESDYELNDVFDPKNEKNKKIYDYYMKNKKNENNEKKIYKDKKKIR